MVYLPPPPPPPHPKSFLHLCATPQVPSAPETMLPLNWAVPQIKALEGSSIECQKPYTTAVNNMNYVLLEWPASSRLKNGITWYLMGACWSGLISGQWYSDHNPIQSSFEGLGTFFQVTVTQLVSLSMRGEAVTSILASEWKKLGAVPLWSPGVELWVGLE